MPQDFVISITAGADLGKRLEHASADARRTIRDGINSVLLLYANNVRGRIGRTFTRRTGMLEHIVIEPATTTNLEGKVGSAAPYARIQELGGTIEPKNVDHLTIPLDAIKTKRGVARGTARDIINDPDAYGFTSTFFANDILFGKRSAQAGRDIHGRFVKRGTAGASDITPLFLLVDSVTLPARPTWGPALTEITPVFENKMRSAFSTLFARSA